MKKFLLCFTTILFLIVFLVSVMFYVYPEYNFNFELVISFLSVVYIMIDSDLKYFRYLWMKVLFVLTVLLQSISTCILVFANMSIIKNINILSSVMIIAELSAYTVMRLLKEYIINDIKILEFKTKRKLNKINSNKTCELKEVDSIFDDIKKWIYKNKNNVSEKQNEFKKVMNLMSDSVGVTESLIIKRKYLSDGTQYNFEEGNDKLKKILEDSYYVMRKDMKLLNQFLKLFFVVLNTRIDLKSEELLKEYLDLYIQFLQIEIQSDNPKNVFLIMNKLYVFIRDKADVSDDLYNVLIKKLDNLFFVFFAHNYKVNRQQLHAIVTGYIETLKENSEKIEDIFSVKRLKTIIAIINYESSDSENHSFENFIIADIYSSPSSNNEKINLISRIYKIYDANNFDTNRIVYNMCDFVLDIFKETSNNKEKVQCFKILMQISEKITMENIGIIQPEYIFDSIIKQGTTDEVSKEIIKYISQSIFNHYILYNCFICVVTDILNEENYNDCAYIFKSLTEKLSRSSNKDTFLCIVRLIDRFLDEGSKKYHKNIQEFKKVLSQLLSICDNVLDSECDFEIKKVLLSVLYDYFDDPKLETEIFNYLYEIGIKSIESLDIKITRTVSNYLGWYFFNKLKINKSDIKYYEENDFKKASNIFHKLKKFFQLSSDFLANIEETAMFVGTIFVVNLVQIEIQIKKCSRKNSALSNRYIRLKNVFITELKKLSPDQKEILEKSFKIRIETIERYFENENDIKSICGKLKKELLVNG